MNQQGKPSTKFGCIQYLIIDLNDFMPPGTEFEDPCNYFFIEQTLIDYLKDLLAEIISREEINAKVSQQSKDIIKSLFVRSALSSKAILNLLAALHKFDT